MPYWVGKADENDSGNDDTNNNDNDNGNTKKCDSAHKSEHNFLKRKRKNVVLVENLVSLKYLKGKPFTKNLPKVSEHHDLN